MLKAGWHRSGPVHLKWLSPVPSAAVSGIAGLQTWLHLGSVRPIAAEVSNTTTLSRSGTFGCCQRHFPVPGPGSLVAHGSFYALWLLEMDSPSSPSQYSQLSSAGSILLSDELPPGTALASGLAVQITGQEAGFIPQFFCCLLARRSQRSSRPLPVMTV